MSLESEAALIEIGLKPVLDAKPHFNQAQQARAAKLTERARALVLKFLAGDAMAADDEAEPFDYGAVAAQLETLGEKQAAALHAALPEPLSDDAAADVTRIADNLQNFLPRRVTKSTVKATVQPPEAMELGRYRRRWRVAVDPLVVLRDLVRGAIGPDQVKALAETYPEFFKALTTPGGIIDDAIAVMKARRGEDWDIPIRRDRTLRVLLQGETLNKGLVTAYSALAQQQAAAFQPAAPAGGGTKPIKLNTDEQLPGQRVA